MARRRRRSIAAWMGCADLRVSRRKPRGLPIGTVLLEILGDVPAPVLLAPPSQTAYPVPEGKRQLCKASSAAGLFELAHAGYTLRTITPCSRSVGLRVSRRKPRGLPLGKAFWPVGDVPVTIRPAPSSRTSPTTHEGSATSVWRPRRYDAL